MRAYSSRTKYSGSFTEGFDGAIEQYETMVAVFELSQEDMAKGFPIMLTGAAFSHYSRHYSKKRMSYTELVDAFRASYTSEEQKYRLLKIGQRPSLVRAMQNEPEKSELEVFREVSEELVSVQHQLHSDYHNDRFLRDQLLIAADTSHLHRSLAEKFPSTAREAMQRIATHLSSEPRSAGANFTGGSKDYAYYGLRKKFGGEARKKLKGFGSSRSRRKLSKLLANAKGCYVCGKDHRARQAHNPQEIIAAIERIKKENSSALFSTEDVTDMQYAFAAMTPIDGEDNGKDKQNPIQMKKKWSECTGQARNIIQKCMEKLSVILPMLPLFMEDHMQQIAKGR